MTVSVVRLFPRRENVGDCFIFFVSFHFKPFFSENCISFLGFAQLIYSAINVTL